MGESLALDDGGEDNLRNRPLLCSVEHGIDESVIADSTIGSQSQ
jgi:hypothetical protein